MPNICENWIFLSGNQDIIKNFENKVLDLDLIDKLPTGLSRDDEKKWIHEHWSTQWISEMDDQECPVRLRKCTDGVEAFFVSAWSPPVAFYNRIAEKYPELKVEYEYSVWEMGFVGYGVGASEGEPNHFRYQSKDEMKNIIDMRKWNISIWNPHFIENDSN